MQENKLPLGHDGVGDDCMGKAMKYGILGVYGEWCAITRICVLNCFTLAGFAVLPVSYLNTTLRKSYVSRGPWIVSVSLHALKTTTLFGEYKYWDLTWIRALSLGFNAILRVTICQYLGHYKKMTQILIF